MKSVVLLIDDDPVDIGPLRLLLESWDLEVISANSGREGLELLRDRPVDLLMTDYYMPGMTGEEVLLRAHEEVPSLPVVIVTGQGDVKSAVAAMKEGAFDYITKPPDEDEFKLTVERALEHSRLRRENECLRAELGARGRYGDRLLGRSAAMLSVFQTIDKVARTDSTVLITGETGTGKELVAQTIHFKSKRSAGPLVAFNCAALNPNLVESELFGHERGAFTGAQAARRGRFEEASGGTLFLDEVAETSFEFQAKLLRALQEKEIERVGGNQAIAVDVRVLASTNKDLAGEVEAGRFRKDLYFRLRVIPIEIPPLRDRPEDIALLAQHFVEHFAGEYGSAVVGISEAGYAYLRGQPWPGNVRELEHAVERAVVMAEHRELGPADFKDAPRGEARNEQATLKAYLDERGKAYLLQVLESTQWQKQQAAEILGIDRVTLYRMLKKYNLERTAR